VEGNFQPNIDYDFCFRARIQRAGGGRAFGRAVAEMALGMALGLARESPPRTGSSGRAGRCTVGSRIRMLSSLRFATWVHRFGNLGRVAHQVAGAVSGSAVRVYDPWLADRWLAEFG